MDHLLKRAKIGCGTVRSKDRSQPPHTLHTVCDPFFALLFHGHEREGPLPFKWKYLSQKSACRQQRGVRGSVQHRLQCFPFCPFFAPLFSDSESGKRAEREREREREKSLEEYSGRGRTRFPPPAPDDAVFDPESRRNGRTGRSVDTEREEEEEKELNRGPAGSSSLRLCLRVLMVIETRGERKRERVSGSGGGFRAGVR